MTTTLATTDDLIELVRDKLAGHLREYAGETLRELKTLRIYSKPFSVTTFLRAKTDRGVHRFVMKRATDHPANAVIVAGENQALVEFEALRRLYPAMEGIDGCSVPRPVTVLPEVNAFVMEFVEGHLMEEELSRAHYFSSSARYRSLQTHYLLCGRWLRHFQQITGPRNAGEEAVAGVLKRSEERLRLIEELDNRRCPRDFRRRVTDFLSEQTEQLRGEEVVVAGRHGDFGPWNVLIDRQGVTVIDFFGFREDPLPVDVLKMLLHFEVSRMHPANSPRRVAALREGFLAGFGRLPRVPTALAAICEAMHRICSVYGTLCGQQNRLARRIQLKRCLSTNLRWLLGHRPKPRLWPQELLR